MPLEIARNDEGQMGWKYVPQGSGGSTSVSEHYQALRQAGALARTLLVAAAAEQFGVPASELTVAKGVVRHQASDRQATYGALAAAAALIQPPETAP
jgi:isoquinoline 1-oxidoreductase beta subunit